MLRAQLDTNVLFVKPCIDTGREGLATKAPRIAIRVSLRFN